MSTNEKKSADQSGPWPAGGTGVKGPSDHPYWRGTLARMRATLPQLLLYDLAFKSLTFALLAPAGAWVLERLVARSGDLAVTNNDILSFLLTPAGIVFVLLGLGLLLTSVLAELAGLILIGGADTPRVYGWFSALKATVRDLPLLAATALVAAILMVLAALPLAALIAWTYSTLLSAHDINWYLAERPPAFWIAAVIGAVLATVSLAILALALVRWSLAIPVIQSEGLWGRAALKRSWQLVGRRPWRVARLVLAWIGATLLVSALVLAALRWLGSTLLGLFAGADAQIAIAALWLGLLAIGAALLSFIAFTGYGLVVSRLYAELTDQPPAAAVAASDVAWGIGPWSVAATLALVLVVSAIAVHGLIDDLKLGRSVAVTAHRGSSAKAPENSLSAIRQAIADGADFAEIDVQETADGALVLLHDTDLMRVTGLPRKIWEVDYSEIRDLDAGSWFSPEFDSERIPTLSQAIETARGQIDLNIELKYNGHDQRLAEAAIETVHNAGFSDHCIITSLNRDALTTVRRIAPGLRIGQIVTVAVGDPRRLDLDLLSMEASQATPAAVRANRAAGLQTHVWTVNTREAMERMIERGVSNIITDDPALLRSVIAERATRSDGELLLLALAARLRN